MNKTCIGAASYYKQLYYANPEFEDMPTGIRNELREICIYLAEKLHGVFMVGFYEDGSIYFESEGEESDYNFDEIGAKLEIKELTAERPELIRSLGLWYSIYRTDMGEDIRKALLDEKCKRTPE